VKRHHGMIHRNRTACVVTLVYGGGLVFEDRLDSGNYRLSLNQIADRFYVVRKLKNNWKTAYSNKLFPLLDLNASGEEKHTSDILLI
jgi:hypothetical protein